jgi:hypothetical protein
VAPKERLIALPAVSLGPPRYPRETAASSLGAEEGPPRYPRETAGVSQGATNPTLILSPSGILSSPPETRHAPQSRRVPILSEAGEAKKPPAERVTANAPTFPVFKDPVQEAARLAARKASAV